MSGAALFHPFETIVFFVMATVVTTLVLGLDPVAAALTGYVAAFYGYFQHMNIRTPQWLGYIVQRPESHSVHHGRGIHHYNYSDLPLFDILFGTFRNPKEYVAESGFYDGASALVPQILVFKDVAGADFNPAMKLN